jgi:Fe-S cluster biogenesis protein NfuA
MAPTDEFARMKEVVETISHYAQIYHNGTVELIAFDGEHVQVKMGGACEGCPLMPWTLKMTVERTIRDLFPNVKSVEAVQVDTR